MKEMFGNLGSDPKFNTLVKLAFYSLFVFIAIILINTADISQLNNEVNNNNQDNDESKLIELPDSYEYSYTINIDDKIYSYQGIVDENNHILKKNKDNKITEYKYINNKYYISKKEKDVEILDKEVYDIVNYEYLNIEKINQYLENSEEQEGKYLVYLKDQVTGEATDVYIEITKEINNVKVDYSMLDDNYQKFVIEFEYEERKGEINESEN